MVSTVGDPVFRYRSAFHILMGAAGAPDRIAPSVCTSVAVNRVFAAAPDGAYCARLRRDHGRSLTDMSGGVLGVALALQPSICSVLGRSSPAPIVLTRPRISMGGERDPLTNGKRQPSQR